MNGKNYWRFTVVGKEPVFPDGGDAYCEYEIKYAFGQAAEPAGEDVTCTLYADEIPPVRRVVPVESALIEWC
jgi:hypothetical protein